MEDNLAGVAMRDEAVRRDGSEAVGVDVVNEGIEGERVVRKGGDGAERGVGRSWIVRVERRFDTGFVDVERGGFMVEFVFGRRGSVFVEVTMGDGDVCDAGC